MAVTAGCYHSHITAVGEPRQEDGHGTGALRKADLGPAQQQQKRKSEVGQNQEEQWRAQEWLRDVVGKSVGPWFTNSAVAWL